MNITVKGKNVELTEALQEYARKKVDKLSRHFQNLNDAVITLGVQRNWQTVEVTLEGDGVVFRGQERTNDMYASVDQVAEKLDRQIRRLKGKLIDRVHPDEAHIGQASTIEPPEPEETGQIVRTKRFTLKPMTPEEAAMQMESLNHDFFIFANSDTDLINVIYKRHDGNYGLIEPES